MALGQGFDPNLFLNTDKEAEALAQAYAGYGDIVDQQTGLANEFRQRLTELERTKPQSKLQKIAGIASYILPAIGAVIDKTSGDPQKRREAMPQYEQTMAQLQAIRDKAALAKSQKKDDELRSLKAQYEIGIEPIRAAAAKQDMEIKKRREVLDLAREKAGNIREGLRFDAQRAKYTDEQKKELELEEAYMRLTQGTATPRDVARLGVHGKLPEREQTLSPEESIIEFDVKADEFAAKYVDMLDASKTMTPQEREAAFVRARKMFIGRYRKKEPQERYNPAQEGDMSPEQAQEMLNMLSQGMMTPQAQPASTLIWPNVKPRTSIQPVPLGGFRPLGVR